MINHLFVLILSETRSLFRAAMMNSLLEVPPIAQYLQSTSHINRIIGKTVLRYVASIIGIYLFTRATNMTSAISTNTTADSPTHTQLYVSAVCLIFIGILLVQYVFAAG